MLSDSNSSIKCTELGKCFQIYESPKARLKQALWRGRRQYFQEFWALRHVNFEVRRGESLGIIGRNGSGKSTLLQLVSGTLTPTEGEIEKCGRIAALLELGSGFNPEFTGIENIFLNASMLGLNREETEAQLDNILSFADIGSFVEQPVKTYSSGMVVRLAFAVVAHVNADILIVDEALAVGDAVFTQRCMRFIRRLREDKCLLFVSHDSEAVKSLCSHALWLANGEIRSSGDCKRVALNYLQYCQAESYGEEIRIESLTKTRIEASSENTEIDSDDSLKESIWQKAEQSLDYQSEGDYEGNLLDSVGWKTGSAELVDIRISSLSTNASSRLLRGGEEVEICVKAKVNRGLSSPILGFIVKDRLGQSLFGENTLFRKGDVTAKPAIAGQVVVGRFRLIMPMLPTGEYTVMASIADGDITENIQHHWVEDAVVMRVYSSRVRYGLVGAFIQDIRLEVKDDEGDE